MTTVADQRNRLLEMVACQAAETCFVTDYKTPDNLEDRKLDGLGIAISQWAEWDIGKILLVCASALEDSNAHDVCAMLRAKAQGMEQENQAFWEKAAQDNGKVSTSRFRSP